MTLAYIQEKGVISCLRASRHPHLTLLPMISACSTDVPTLLLNIAEKWSNLQLFFLLPPSLLSLPIPPCPKSKALGFCWAIPSSHTKRLSLQMPVPPPALLLSHTHTHPLLSSSILVAFSFTKTIILVSVNTEDSNMFQIIAEAQHEKFTSNPTQERLEAKKMNHYPYQVIPIHWKHSNSLLKCRDTFQRTSPSSAFLLYPIIPHQDGLFSEHSR